MTILVPLKKKYLASSGGKAVKNMKAGNGKRAGLNKVSWKANTGLGLKH